MAVYGSSSSGRSHSGNYGLASLALHSNRAPNIHIKLVRVHAFKPVGKIAKALVERPPTLDGGNNDLFIEFFGVIQRRPTSDIGMWNVMQRATKDLLTTANSSEDLYRRIRTKSVYHPQTFHRLAMKQRFFYNKSLRKSN